MNSANALIKSAASVAAVPRVRPNPARLRKPSPLPLRPLVPDRFRPPRGEKQVFLPNFIITFLRTPTQPPHFASFLTPLWFNKLDLKDYLYNVYGVQVLRVRSFVIQGKVTKDRYTARVSRASAKKKMTVELVQGVEGQGPFIWPEEPKDIKPNEKMQIAQQKYLGTQRKREQPDEKYKLDPEDAKSLKERATLLLQ
ncbi:MAG: hypothetical protein Q9175_006898, partial [Cornicularia normoerica]